jgi:drug/metabolite transporter, DME family
MKTSAPPRSPLTAALAVLGAAALFGTTGTAQALGPQATTPLGVGAVRLAIGATVLLALALLDGRAPRGAWRAALPALLAGGAGVAGYQLTWFAGLRHTGVALGTVVGIGSGPVFAGLIHVARGARPSRVWLAGTALTICGASLLAARGGAGGSGDAAGIALMLGAGLSYAVYAEAGKRAIDAGLGSSHAMAGVFGAGALLVAPFLVREPLGWVATPRGAAMAVHLGVLTVGAAYWLYGRGLRRLSVPTVVTLTLAEPLTAAALAVTVLGETLGPAGWAGAATIVAGLLVASSDARRAASGEPEPATPPPEPSPG